MRESARWIHVPPAGHRIEDGERMLVLLPSREGPSRVWRSWPAREGAKALILKTIREARDAGVERLVWHTGDAVSPPFVDELLPEHGFEMTEDLDVLAFELGSDPEPRLPNLPSPSGILARLVETGADLSRAHTVNATVFPASARAKPDLEAYLRCLSAFQGGSSGNPDGDATPRSFLCVASVPNHTRTGEHEVIASAGAELSGETIRLWGAGTLPAHRGRGAYRALVIERCRLAHARGATLALTKANAATSSSILLSAGFRPVAKERRYTLKTCLPTGT